MFGQFPVCVPTRTIPHAGRQPCGFLKDAVSRRKRAPASAIETCTPVLEGSFHGLPAIET